MNELIIKTFIRALREFGYYDVFPKTLGYRPIAFFGDVPENETFSFESKPFFGCNSLKAVEKRLNELMMKNPFRKPSDKETQIEAIIMPLNILLHFFLAANGKSLEAINKVGDYVFSNVGERVYGKEWVKENSVPNKDMPKPTESVDILGEHISPERLEMVKRVLDKLMR